MGPALRDKMEIGQRVPVAPPSSHASAGGE